MFPTKEIEDKVIEFSETEDKAGLDEYAKTFDVSLDRRKKFDNMVESFAEELGKLPKETFGEPTTEPEQQEVDDEPTSEDTDVEEQTETQTDDEESKSDGDLDTTEEQPEQEVEESQSELEKDFRPAFELTFSDRRHGGEYANVGYWIIDELQKHRVIEREWSQEAIDECRHKKEIQTILYYIEKNGSCLVRESRNSRFYRIYKNSARVSG